MKVLITGGAGFIGVNLTAFLCDTNNYEITILDNETMGSSDHLSGFDVNFIKGDILSDDDLNHALQGQNVVVHLAADTRVMDSVHNPAHNFQVNAVGSFKLLEACRKHSISRVIAASTGGAILGEAPAPVHEQMVARPLAPYGASKLSMEGYLSAFAGAYGITSCALRFSNVYGPRSFHKGSVVSHFYKHILKNQYLVVYGDGTQVRDYLYVGDLVIGIEKAMTSDVVGTFQLGSGRPTTINELLGVIRTVIGERDFKVHYEDFRAGEIHTTWCDITKSKTEFGFNPSTSLAEGMKLTWDWFLKNMK